jgi:hydrogenase-4 membrane subunit HyfE
MSLADFLLAHTPVTLPRHLYSYVEGQTPLSTTPTVLVTLAGYLALIFGIQAAMKNRQPQRLNTLFQAHNMFLSGGSLLLLVLLLEEIVPIIWNTGIFDAMCSERSWTPVSSRCTLRQLRAQSTLENGVLLHGQLLLQIPRVIRHRLPRLKKEATPCVGALPTLYIRD